MSTAIVRVASDILHFDSATTVTCTDRPLKFKHTIRIRTARATSVVSMSAAEEGHKYIIIGGGTAGCVLANRLSSDKVSFLAMWAFASGPGVAFHVNPLLCRHCCTSQHLESVYCTYNIWAMSADIPQRFSRSCAFKPRSLWRLPAHRVSRMSPLGQDNSVLVLEAGSPKFNDRDIKMPIAILRYIYTWCASKHKK